MPPKCINVTIFVQHHLSSRPEMFCKKVFLEISQNSLKKPVLKCRFNTAIGLRPAVS